MITLSTVLDRAWRVVPEAPRTLADAGLSADLVTQLALKSLHFAGELEGSELAYPGPWSRRRSTP